MQGDICCARCGANEESINHMFFECPPAIQVWTLSKIPTNPVILPKNFLFTNMDHLFWRVAPPMGVINLLGYFGTFGNEEIIRFLVIWIWILGTL